MITPKKIKEVLEHNCINLRFHARGGQGGVTASNLCVEAFYGYGICQPRFGAERMGSPTESYVRLSLSKELIRSNEQVYAPHFVAILDESLMWEINVTEGLPKGGWIIINTDMNQLEVQELIERKDLNIATIPATTIALDVFGRNAGLSDSKHPMGRVVELEALKGKKYISIPYVIKGMDVSFSGILTHVSKLLQNGSHTIQDLSFSLQETVFAMLVEVTERALAHTKKNEVMVTGGVASNNRLKEMLECMASSHDARFKGLNADLAIDNGVMIAWLGILMFQSGIRTKIEDTLVDQHFRPEDVEVIWRKPA